MPDDSPKQLTDLPATRLRWIGRSVGRLEDPLLLTGKAPFVDNLAFPGMLHCAILRSPHAHAVIRSIDLSRALCVPGVVAAVAGEDAARWTQPVPTFPQDWGNRCLAVRKVTYVGQPVAAIAACSRYVAEDALEQIEVDYEVLPALMNPQKTMQSDSPLIFESKGTNVVYHHLFKWGEIDEAFRSAHHVFSETFRWHRMGANPIETFGVISQWEEAEGIITCHGAFQAPGHFAVAIAGMLGVATNRIRLIAQPHGGSFGGKGGGAGTVITAMLSRKAGGRPVKWIEDRMEYLAGGGGQAWDRHYEGSLAVCNDGRVLGFKVKLIDDLGASPEGFGAVGAAKPLSCFTGSYTIPAAEYDLTLVLTNKLPVSPYRGMGPPPHYVVLEQLMDMAARGLGMDPAELRRRNFIRPDQFPYTIPTGNEYDSGNYEAALDAVLEMADYRKLRHEQEQARSEGRLLGIGLVSTIEPGVFDWNAYAILGLPLTGVPEGVRVAIDVGGKITARVGFALEGQGQYTLIAQVLADYFGVDIGDVRVICQDSLSAPPHFGPGGSRLGVAVTAAALGAAEKINEKLVRVAARVLQVEPATVELLDGKLRARERPGAELPLAQVAAIMLTRSDLLPPGIDPNPEATHAWTAPGRTAADEHGRAKSYLTAAHASHLVLVEVDRETGAVRILGYWIADDYGTRLNPATVEGMTQGGVAQGVGAALLEEYVYDERGQLLTSTFMDYLLPTIHEVPMPEKRGLVTPSPFSPLGAKGAGEGPIHTTPAAMICAINDALHPLGVRITEVPASPARLWNLLHRLAY